MIISQPIERVVMYLTDANNWRWPDCSFEKAKKENANEIIATYVQRRLPKMGLVIRWSVSRTDHGGSQVVTFTNMDDTASRVEYTFTSIDNGSSTDIVRDPLDDGLLLRLKAALGDSEALKEIEKEPGTVPHSGPP